MTTFRPLMMKEKAFLSLILSLLFFGFSYSQVTLQQESFETTSGYTSSIAFQTDSGDDYFLRGEDGDFGMVNLTGEDGTFYIGAEDTDADGMPGEVGVTLDAVVVSGYNTLDVQIAAAAPRNNAYDAADDYLYVEYNMDGGGWTRVGAFENDGTAFNQEMRLDSDLDGTGEGAQLTSTFQDFTFSIPVTGTSLQVRVLTYMNSGNEEIAFDNVRVRGVLACTPASISSVSPTTGPVGTVVTINASAGDLTGASVTFNGTAATVLSSSTTQLEVEVPSGATTGDIVITDSQPCDATYSSFTVINDDTTSCDVVGSGTFTDLFISEVTDASAGSLSYVEIFNATGATIDMTNYVVRITNNGSANTDIPLTGMLNDNDSFILATAVGGSSCPGAGGDGSLADQTDVSSGVNNNDCITLRAAGTLTLIDIWGVCDGSSWINALGLGSEGYDFQRLGTSTAPSTTFDSSEWTIVDFDSCDDNYADIESYDGTRTAPTVTGQPSISLASCGISTSLTVTGTEAVSGGAALAYQWYFSAPGDAGWTALTDAGVYTGSMTATLSISSIIGLDGYQYYCQLREDDATCFQASESNRLDIGATVSTWNGMAWDVVPDNTRITVIDGDFDTGTDGNIDACSLFVDAAATLTIEAGDYVSIENDLTVDGDLQVEHEGSLVMVDDSGAVTVNGNLDVHKTTTTLTAWYDYTFWSSPITNETIGSVFAGVPAHRIHRFETANFNDANADGSDDEGDDWITVGPATVMTPGVGYITTSANSGTFPRTDDRTFNGAVNNGVVQPTVVLNGAVGGSDDWNLLGNPYPSAVDADLLLGNAANTGVLDGTIYFWVHNLPPSATNPGPYGHNFSTDDYASYSFGLGAGTAAVSGGATPNGNIASGQSFFVESIANGMATFNNSMRITSGNDQFFRGNTAVAQDKDLIWLNLTNEEGAFSQILLGFTDEATMQADRGYDGRRFAGGFVSFYSLINDDIYAIQGRPGIEVEDVIPLGISTLMQSQTLYAIDIDDMRGDFNLYDIFLHDKTLNVMHDLKTGAYRFDIEVGTFNDRFEIVFQKQILSVDDPTAVDRELLHYTRDGITSIFMSDASLIQGVEAYDMLGRKLLQEHVNGGAERMQLPMFQEAPKIIRVTHLDGTIYVKKIIR